MLSKHARFKKPDARMEARINKLVSAMTLEEKIAMIGGAPQGSDRQGDTIGCQRLGIPVFRMADASSGVHWWNDKSTTFPVTIALSATFNTELAYQYGSAIADDCLAAGVHILLGPGVNIYRSPLCGRNFEYMGEDPFLASRMVVAYVEGLQDKGVSATVKHYAVNYQEFERHKVSSDLDERTLREIYLPAFEAAVREGGAGAIMMAYNSVNSVHCSEHPGLIHDILKSEWKFDGVVMSDWASTYDAVNAANAGLDLEMPFAKWMNKEYLVPAIREGRLLEKVIDDKIRRFLRLAFAFGWMEHEQKKNIPGLNERNAAVALDVARESIVLLKNDGILPVDFAKYRRVAVIGSMADPAVISGGGSGYNPPWRTVSILDGLKVAAKGKTKIVHSMGHDIYGLDNLYNNSKFQTASGQPGVEVEYFNNWDFSGSPIAARVEERINNLWQNKPMVDGLDRRCFSVRFKAVLKVPEDAEYVFIVKCWDGAFRLQIDGNPFIDRWLNEVLGESRGTIHLSAGEHVFQLEYRSIRGWNELQAGWGRADWDEATVTEAVETAKASDLVVFCGGHSQKSEGEGFDRTFTMVPQLEKLLGRIVAVNPHVILVLTAGGNIDMNAWHDKVRAIIHAWYPGQEGGTAVAEVLDGRVNPSGRLPATFEKNLEDRSSSNCYHDDDNDFRVTLSDGIMTGFRHFDRSGTVPRYAFGYGLSYTSFAYENLSLSEKKIEAKGTLKISFDIVNTGKREGMETAQVYVGDDKSSVARPVKELKGFVKVKLAPGERKRVSVAVKAKSLSFWDLESGSWKLEPGTFTVYVAASATDIRLKGSFSISRISRRPRPA